MANQPIEIKINSDKVVDFIDQESIKKHFKELTIFINHLIETKYFYVGLDFFDENPGYKGITFNVPFLLIPVQEDLKKNNYDSTAIYSDWHIMILTPLFYSDISRSFTSKTTLSYSLTSKKFTLIDSNKVWFVKASEINFPKEVHFTEKTGCFEVRKHLNPQESSPNFYLITDFKHGINMMFYVDERLEMDISEKIELILVAAIAVKQQLKDKDIIHNDLKPEHFIYNENDKTAIIVDFGFAQEADSKALQEGYTAAFVAPEYYKNIPRTFFSDIYSFGKVCLSLLNSNDFNDEYKYKYKYKESEIFEENASNLQNINYSPIFNIIEDEKLRDSVSKIILTMLNNEPKERGTIEQHIDALRKLLNELKLQYSPNFFSKSKEEKHPSNINYNNNYN